ncbi:lipopolysaccharide biosynthesis protein [Pontixanthobacter aquaemixtae]|uniref:Oligosaccharide flippase family protein n=1 Tax=Pontixanthobacter aquaemixtae TaxID=1958940 RepID=A0A844ZSW3_9SPHN|nr:oligosaccharide flippase family protein [Pontixanthobacter aquaemixtae]MXO90983.1 oligosaccharide flippase family protein [Pontixanthobacter aquaemixtae]
MTADQPPIAGERRDLRRGALQLLGGSGVRIFARVLLITFVARMYGIEDFGRMGETVAMIELLATLATFGLSKTLLGKLGGENGDDDDVGRHIVNAAVLAGTLSTVLVVVLWISWPLFASADLAGFQFVLLGIPLIALAEVATTATRHFRTAFWDMFVKAFVRPWSFLLLSVAAYFGLIGASLPSGQIVTSQMALLSSYVLSLLLTAGAAIFALKRAFGAHFFKRSGKPIGKSVIDLAKLSWPTALNDTGLFAFRRIDVIILAVVAGPAETAVYYMARQISTVIEKVRHLYEPVLAPIIAQSKSLETIGSHLARLGLLIFAVQLLALCLLAVFGGTLLSWLGAGFATGLLVLLVILIGELFDGGFGLCELPMVYRNPAWPPRLVLASLALEIGLVWILAQKFGALGAAIGFAISMFALAAMRLWMVRSLYGFKVLSIKHVALVVIAVVALFLINLVWPLSFL